MSLLFTDVRVLDVDALRAPPQRAGGVGPVRDPLAATSAPTDLLVEGATITVIGPSARVRAAQLTPLPRVIAGGGHHLLVPGLINAHFHSPANHLKGALPSLPLEEFMLFESPADAELAPTPREAYLRTMLGALEMLRGGTTSVQDDAFLMPAPTPEVIDAVMSAYADAGMRATLALDSPELPEADKLPLDGILPDHLRSAAHAPPPADREQLLAAYDHLVRTWHGAADGRLRAAASVSAPQRVSPEYFAALDALAAAHGMPVFCHVLETKAQRHLSRTMGRFGGASLLRWTAEQHLLTERTNVIHGVWLDEADADLIAASGATLVHNPGSNLRLGSGVMPWRMLREAGVTIALGTDEAICGDAVDVWEAVRLTGLVHNVTGSDADTWPRAGEVLDALWRGGAHAMLAADRLGRIAPGYEADLALLDLHTLAFTPLNDVAGQLVYCAGGRDVSLVTVAGRVVAEGGRVVGVDEPALMAEAREVFAARRPTLLDAADRAAAWHPSYRRVVAEAAGADLGLSRWVGR